MCSSLIGSFHTFVQYGEIMPVPGQVLALILAGGTGRASNCQDYAGS